jgi:hypothetical protein
MEMILGIWFGGVITTMAGMMTAQEIKPLRDLAGGRTSLSLLLLNSLGWPIMLPVNWYVVSRTEKHRIDFQPVNNYRDVEMGLITKIKSNQEMEGILIMENDTHYIMQVGNIPHYFTKDCWRIISQGKPEVEQ